MRNNNVAQTVNAVERNRYFEGFVACCMPILKFFCMYRSVLDNPATQQQLFDVAKHSFNSFLEYSVRDPQLRYAFITTNSNFWNALAAGNVSAAVGANQEWQNLLLNYANKYKGDLKILYPVGYEVNLAERFICDKVRDAIDNCFAGSDNQKLHAAVDNMFIYFEDTLISATDVLMNYAPSSAPALPDLSAYVDDGETKENYPPAPVPNNAPVMPVVNPSVPAVAPAAPSAPSVAPSVPSAPVNPAPSVPAVEVASNPVPVVDNAPASIADNAPAPEQPIDSQSLAGVAVDHPSELV